MEKKIRDEPRAFGSVEGGRVLLSTAISIGFQSDMKLIKKRTKHDGR
jgi:hypothetical protein